MMPRYTLTDRVVMAADAVLRRALGPAPTPATRPSPAKRCPEGELAPVERRHAAGLMRVNHAGEVAAQALYEGQSLFARDPRVREALRQSADEEADHLAWCRQRLAELGARPSRLDRLWYAGSFALGALAAAGGDRASLGFVAETERQVVDHLRGHVARLPRRDRRSRAILEQMILDEAVHGGRALAAGGKPPPGPVRLAMRAASKLMTGAAYWV